MKLLYWKIILAALTLACVVMAVDRYRITMRLNNVAEAVYEKKLQLQANQKIYASELKKKEQEIQLLNRQIHLVFPGEQVIRETPELHRKLRFPDTTLDGIGHFLQGYAEKNGNAPLEICSNQSVINPMVHLAELACQDIGYRTRVETVWDMKDLQRKTILVVSERERKKGKKTRTAQSREVIAVFGKTQPVMRPVVQSSPATIVFPFCDLPLSQQSQEIVLVERGTQLPLGGLYVHRFQAKHAARWSVEIELPKDWTAEQANLLALPLCAGCTVKSFRNGNVQSFYATGNDEAQEADFLVFGGSALFPRRITACLQNLPERSKDASSNSK